MSDGRDDGRGGTLRHRPPRQYLHSEPQGRLAARVATSREARQRRLGLMICGALSAVVLLVAGGAWGLTGYINDTIKRVNAGTSDSGTTGPLNILVAGVDQRTGLTHHQEVVLHVGSDVSTNSDTLMLMHVSADRSRVTVVSIPRDSWVDIPGHGMSKINAAYGDGGPKLMVQTVEQATGLTVNDYVEVNFLGFVKVIDALGGVNICLPEPVDDPYSGLQLSAGVHHVDGITALAYARDRHSFASSDLARIQDQQKLMSSALTSAIHSGLLANPVKLSSFIERRAVRADRGQGPERVRAGRPDAGHHRPGRPVHDRAAGQRELRDARRPGRGAVGPAGGRVRCSPSSRMTRTWPRPPRRPRPVPRRAHPAGRAGSTAGRLGRGQLRGQLGAGASPSATAGSSAAGQTATQDACG